PRQPAADTDSVAGQKIAAGGRPAAWSCRSFSSRADTLMADNARLLAVRGLLKVLPAEGGGKSLREVLADQPVLLAAERGLLADLMFGVCRHQRLLDHWLNQQMDKPLKSSAKAVRLALLCGIYELWFSERPQHAVVNAWPDVCRALHAPWAAGLDRKSTRLNSSHVKI